VKYTARFSDGFKWQSSVNLLHFLGKTILQQTYELISEIVILQVTMNTGNIMNKVEIVNRKQSLQKLDYNYNIQAYKKTAVKIVIWGIKGIISTMSNRFSTEK